MPWRRRVYLAGPDVFLPDAAEAGARKRALCDAFGFEGCFPLDEVAEDVPPGELSRRIYAANIAMIAAADFGIFNLTPFRGPSADPGTVFELGVFIGAGKPVFAYSNVDDGIFARVTAAMCCAPDGATWRDPAGMSVEDFGNADNLMIDEALRLQGRRFHRRATPQAVRFSDLAGFRACLDDASAAFGEAAS